MPRNANVFHSQLGHIKQHAAIEITTKRTKKFSDFKKKAQKLFILLWFHVPLHTL